MIRFVIAMRAHMKQTRRRWLKSRRQVSPASVWNRSFFPSVVAQPNQTLQSTIVYKFGVQTLRAGISSYPGLSG